MGRGGRGTDSALLGAVLDWPEPSSAERMLGDREPPLVTPSLVPSNGILREPEIHDWCQDMAREVVIHSSA